MSNNIFNSSDDDLFEDYVESPISESIEDNTTETNNNFDKVFSDLDSPFKNLLQNSSLKVNFGDAFYKAAHEWTMQGYREANTLSIIDGLVALTDGQFLYHHRLACSRETLARKKTIIKFLSMLLEDGTPSVVKATADNEDFTAAFTETYFSMFFRSFYNIQLHTFHHEAALYKALCEVLNVEPDLDLCNPTVESYAITDTADYINSLYIQHFDKDLLQEKIDKYVQQVFPTQDQA
jgi:hypothetical protein